MVAIRNVSTTFQGIDSIADPSIGERIRPNLISFFNWGLIDNGAFFNVTTPSSGQYGGDKTRLRLVNDGEFTNGQVWQGFRSNWVWESGVAAVQQPIQVSGVTVNGVFHPVSGIGRYAHHVDYPNGQVVFNQALPANSIVNANYSYHWVNVLDSNEIPFLKHIQYGSLHPESVDFTLSGSGDYNELSRTRLQLPAIGIEIGTKTDYYPYQLGGGQYCRKTVVAHILAEDDGIAGKLADVLSAQNESTIYLYDTKLMSEQGRFPLDINGSVASGALTYPQLVAPTEYGGFLWRKLRFATAESQNGQWINKLYTCSVKFVTEVVIPDI